MKQSKWTKGTIALLLFGLTAASTILFIWLGPLLPSNIHTDIAVPVMLVVWLFGIPFSFILALVSRSESQGGNAGRITLKCFGISLVLIVLASIFQSLF